MLEAITTCLPIEVFSTETAQSTTTGSGAAAAPTISPVNTRFATARSGFESRSGSIPAVVPPDVAATIGAAPGAGCCPPG